MEKTRKDIVIQAGTMKAAHAFPGMRPARTLRQKEQKKMNRCIVAIAVTCAASMLARADRMSLDGLWDFRMEPGKSLESLSLPEFEPNAKMIVPGAWDAMSRWYNVRGTGCYRRTFTLDKDVCDAFLVVDGCCLRSRFWIDGKEIGFCNLPWSRFELRTGPLSAGEHEMVAAVDSVVDGAKVKLFHNYYDFYAPGGFHRGMWLEPLPSPDALRGIAVRIRDWRRGLVELEAIIAGGAASNFTADVSFDGAKPSNVLFTNRRATTAVPDPSPWSPECPNMHTVTVDMGSSKATARFGLRQVGTADGRITLNGKPVYLKGANRHEAHFEFGATTPKQLMYEDIANLKDLGGNFIRGAHYAQNDDFLTLCDEMGVLVWEESLGWGNRKDQFADPEFRRLQIEQTSLMVRNSINHPCVIISGFLNEPDSDAPECKSLVDELIATIRAEDSGHLVTFACNDVKGDISHANTDIIAYNVYPGWYSYFSMSGSDDEMRRNIRRCHADVVRVFREKYRDNRPIIVSESGVKADYGVHDPRGRAQYTEDFQAAYTRLMLEEVFANREIGGIAIWQFTDSKTYTRVTPGMRNRSYGVNTGGLYDLYRRPKMAVEVVREIFSRKVEESPE